MGKLTDEQKERYKLKAREKRAKLRKHTESDVTCRLCNLAVNVKGMPIHLQNVHMAEFDAYLVEHLEDFKQFGWGNCETCGKVTKGTTCSRKCMGSLYKQTYAGREPWNKNLTKETSDILKQMGKSVSKSNTGNPKRMGTNNPATRPDVRQRISKTRIDRGVAKGDRNPMFGKTHTEAALRKIFDKRSMTKPEQQLRDILDELHVTYTSQFFITEDSQTFSYDFYLPECQLIIEVDGDYWHGGPGVQEHWYGVETTKATDVQKDMVARQRGYKVLRLWESQLKHDRKLIIDILKRIL
jgi:very-short-patch-repair endonuclease